jgi:hypothetical protein
MGGGEERRGVNVHGVESFVVHVSRAWEGRDDQVRHARERSVRVFIVMRIRVVSGTRVEEDLKTAGRSSCLLCFSV